MDTADKIATIQELCEHDEKATDAVVSVYLSQAEAAILRRLYPFGVPSDAEFPAMYDALSCQLAARYFLRRGAEGETVHNENGIHRHYGSVGDEDLLREVMPYARIYG